MANRSRRCGRSGHRFRRTHSSALARILQAPAPPLAGKQGRRPDRRWSRSVDGRKCAPLARCETDVVYGAETCIYVHRPVMCSGGVVIGVLPAQRDLGGCAAEHNRQRRDDRRGRQDARSRSAGEEPSDDRPMVIGADSFAFWPEVPSVDAHPRGRDIAGSTRRSRPPRAVDYVQQSLHQKDSEQAKRLPVRASCA